MANDSFSDALHRLKEIHDKEVLGMQAKLTELTMEKCRDAQRIEELFSKNHLLREQHKVLNENIKVLENRLRAGLCDRCTVTQELAKKKQQEYENCHFQNLQQISSLTSEINSLKEKNKSLLEELRKGQCLDERSRSRSQTPENTATPEDQRPPLPSPKNNTERTSKDRETGDNNQDHHASEENSAAVIRLSPVLKKFQIPGIEARQAELKMSGVQKVFLNTQSQQKISNQLHGTIAVMRPGIKSGHSTTLLPINRLSPSNDIHPRESCTDMSEVPSPLDPLKHVMPEEQFNLLRQHFAQKLLAQRSSGLASEGPIRYLVAKNHEAVLERKRSEDDWEDKAAMAELQGAVLYLKEQGHKNKANPSNPREKIQYLLSKQNQGLRSPNSPEDAPKCLVRENPEEKEMSLLQVLNAHWRNSRRLNVQEEEQEWSEKETKSVEPERRSHYEEEATTDKPLDLSDTRRVQHPTRLDIKREQTCLPSPPYRNNASPPSRAPSANHLHDGGMESRTMMTKSERERDFQDATMEEMEMSHSSSTESSRDSFTNEESHRETRWKKKQSQASTKPLKKKKVEDQAADHNSFQEDHHAGKDLEQGRPA
ncbi:RBBP8 N-terminal-like protein [Gastrophryne carolinensis]